MKLSSFSAVLPVLFVAAAASAHGVEVQISFDAANNKIQTRKIVHTESLTSTTIPVGFARGDTLADLARIYVLPVAQQSPAFGTGWYVHPTDTRLNSGPLAGLPAFPSGPGLTWLYDAQAAGSGWKTTGSTALPNLRNTNFSYKLTDQLREWNGSAWIDPGTEQLQIFRGDATSATTAGSITTSDSANPTLALGNISTTTEPTSVASIPHSSISYRLLGDGTSATAEPDNGIYLLSLQLATTAINPVTGTTVGASDTFYYILPKGASTADGYAAALALAAEEGIATSQIQVVPEPAGLLIGAIGAAGLLARRRSVTA